MSHAAQNLKYLRKQKGWTQEELSVALSIKRSLVGAYEEERAEPRLDVMQTICKIFKITLEDFLFKPIAETNLSYLQQRRNFKMAKEAGNLIHLVPIKAAAGYLAGYGDSVFLDELNTFTLPMLATGNYRAFEIVGDSMLPTPSGSIIVGEKLENMTNIKPNNTYIIISKMDGIVYKRIDKTTLPAELLTLTSDNPTYKPYTMKTADIIELWQTQLVISKPTNGPSFDVHQLTNVVTNLQLHVSNLQKQLS